MHLFSHQGHAQLLGMFLSMAPLLTGVWFAFRPSERLLALMRPLTLGAIFAAVCNIVLAVANGCVDISMMNRIEPQTLQLTAAMLSERLAPVIASFASLAVAWFFVAIGTRRS